MLPLGPFTEDPGRPAVRARARARALPPLAFTPPRGLPLARRLACMLDSLVRVSRRAGCEHPASAFAARAALRLGPLLSAASSCASRRALTSAPRFPAAGSAAPHLPGRTLCSQPLPPQQFQVLLNSLSKVLFIFPSRYLSAIGLPPVFSLRWSLPPLLGCIPKQPDSPSRLRGAASASQRRGSHPLRRTVPM